MGVKHKVSKAGAPESKFHEPPLVMPQVPAWSTKTIKLHERSERLRRALINRIDAARAHAVDCAKRGVPDVREGVDALVKIAEEAIGDSRLDDKKSVLWLCALALAKVGEANSGNYAVAENVGKAANALLDAVWQSKELKGDEDVLKALSRAKHTVLARKFEEEGGQPQLMREERLFDAAWYKYGEYCEKFGKPASERQVDAAVSWINLDIGPLTKRMKGALKDKIMFDAAPPGFLGLGD